MDLPLLLAGPILRRAEPRRVCIWLATSRRVDLRATLYEASPATGSPAGESLRAIGVSAPEGDRPEIVQLGEHLFVSLLAIKPFEGIFPTESMLFYDLTMDGKSLAEIGLTGGERSIAYPGMPLPCFFLPERIKRLLHGSCRKPHGAMERSKLKAEEFDALAAADDAIIDALDDFEVRPSLLFLTGDQIYADDVAGPLLVLLNDYGKRLTGWEERIPASGTNGSELTGLNLYGRKDFVLTEAQFSSGEPLNHLLTFGEYAAMYLFVWNPDLWPEAMPKPESLSSKHAETYEREWQVLIGFRDVLHKARRVLANTPSYMIFDDHEITDDWNLHRRWRARVRESRSGRRIVANGLAAYWAFQGWGNSPEAFSPRFIETISEHLTSKLSTGEKADRFDQRLWGFHRWSYYLPSLPPVIVPDSRTQREYDSETGAPRLLDSYGIEWLRTAWADLGEPRHEDLILVASTPVYGFDPLEDAQKVLSSFGVPPQRYDRESWVANKEGFSDLLLLLSDEIRPKRCIILSGDVHYAFSTRARFYSTDNTLRLYQFTSSAINNTPKESKLVKELGRLADRREYRLGWKPGAPRALRLTRPALEFLVRWGLMKSQRTARYYWTDEVESLLPEGKESLLYPFNNIGLVSLLDGGALEHCLITGAIPGDEMCWKGFS